MSANRCFIAVALGIFLVHSISCSEQHDDSNITTATTTLRLAAGTKGGMYYPLAEAIAEVVNGDRFALRVVESPGTLRNLELIEHGDVDLALVQSDVYLTYGSTAQALVSLCSEVVHVMSKPFLNVYSLQQLEGKNVYLGMEGSGSRLTAINILNAAGISEKQVQDIQATSYETVLEGLESSDIDVAFFTFALPATLLVSPIKKQEVNLVPLNPSFVKRLAAENPCFVLESIRKGMYGLERAQKSVAVRAILVARHSALDHSQAKALTASIVMNGKLIADKAGIDQTIGRTSACDALGANIHPGAREFYDDTRLICLMERMRSGWLYAVAGVFGIAYVLSRKNRRVFRLLMSRPFTIALLVLMTAWLVGSVGMYFAERKINDSFDPIANSFWSVIIYLVSGFEDRYPITHTGQAISVLSMIVGSASLMLFTGGIAALLTKRRLEERIMPESMKNHYVLCNWDTRALAMIGELRSEDLKQHSPIVILCENAEEVKKHCREKGAADFRDVHVVSGRPTDEAALRNADVAHARCVIVLACCPGDHRGPESPLTVGSRSLVTSADAYCLMTLMAIKKLCRRRGGKYPHCVAEILDPGNIEMAHQIAEGGEWIEVVSSPEIQMRLMSQAAFTPGLADFYRELLSFQVDSSEIYVIDTPTNCVGKRFRECLSILYEAAPKNNPIIPIGIKRENRIIANPQHNVLIEKTDKLVVLALYHP